MTDAPGSVGVPPARSHGARGNAGVLQPSRIRTQRAHAHPYGPPLPRAKIYDTPRALLAMACATPLPGVDIFTHYGLTRHQAAGLASVVVDLRITQLVNGVRGVYAVLLRGAIEEAGLHQC